MNFPFLPAFLLSTASMAATIHHHSRLNEFLPYLHFLDLFMNSFRSVKNPPPIWAEILPRTQGETSPGAELPGNSSITSFVFR